MIPLRVDTIVISTQHAAEITTEALREEIYEKIIQKVIPKNMLDDRTIYHIQPSGRFVIGGPQGDAGVTGRKIIVDTYGGWGAHGGGAFSGKVPKYIRPTPPVLFASVGFILVFVFYWGHGTNGRIIQKLIGQRHMRLVGSPSPS